MRLRTTLVADEGQDAKGKRVNFLRGKIFIYIQKSTVSTRPQHLVFCNVVGVAER
jgi:hypothetical protein